MDPVMFALAVLALLAAPGPTNTLLAASGACVGIFGSIRLAPAAIGGYLASITVLIGIAGPLVLRHPQLSVALKLAATVWLVRCSLRLWRQAGSEIKAAQPPISTWQIFTTTLVNPKGLIVAFGILPQMPLDQMAPWLAGFSCLTFIVAIGWIWIGVLIARSAGPRATPRHIWRAASLGLAVFATALAGSVIAGLL
jgi:threonine/homoserine/homoserine lactone efflux protein